MCRSKRMIYRCVCVKMTRMRRIIVHTNIKYNKYKYIYINYIYNFFQNHL